MMLHSGGDSMSVIRIVGGFGTVGAEVENVMTLLAEALGLGDATIERALARAREAS